MRLIILDESAENSIPLMEMRDGQIGIITRWSYSYKNAIVQRYKSSLVILGEKSDDNNWYNIFNNPPKDVDSFRVRILPPGTKFQLTSM